MIDATLVTSHGLFSSPATWDCLVEVWRGDQDLQPCRSTRADTSLRASGGFLA